MKKTGIEYITKRPKQGDDKCQNQAIANSSEVDEPCNYKDECDIYNARQQIVAI